MNIIHHTKDVTEISLFIAALFILYKNIITLDSSIEKRLLYILSFFMILSSALSLLVKINIDTINNFESVVSIIKSSVNGIIAGILISLYAKNKKN
jgi:hypothetical protein